MDGIINGTKIKYEDNKVWKFGKKMWKSKEETWHVLKGCIHTLLTTGYKRHITRINGRNYITARVLYKLSHPDWDIDDSSKNNTIDHIDIQSLNNSLDNLRTATMAQQIVNRNYVINQKGYSWNKRAQKWRARISIDGKQKYLGYFVLEADARQAYLNAVAERNLITL
jgi:hypothetical protein